MVDTFPLGFYRHTYTSYLYTIIAAHCQDLQLSGYRTVGLQVEDEGDYEPCVRESLPSTVQI